jgi:hypothetical protein
MNKMGGRRLDGYIRGPRNTRMEETSRRQRIMETSSERGQGSEGAVAPSMDGWNATTFGEIMPCSRDSPYFSFLYPTILSAIYSSSLCARSFVIASYQIPHLSGEIVVLYVYIKMKFNRCINLDGHKIKPQ